MNKLVKRIYREDSLTPRAFFKHALVARLFFSAYILKEIENNLHEIPAIWGKCKLERGMSAWCNRSSAYKMIVQYAQIVK